MSAPLPPALVLSRHAIRHHQTRLYPGTAPSLRATIWVVVGDGGFQMTNQELATLRQETIRNVKVAIISKGYLGMVRQWQCPDFPKE